MSSNEKWINEWYTKKSEDQRAFISRAHGLEFHFTKKLLEKYVGNQSKIIEIGCGTGYYGMFLHDLCKEYTGVDIVPENLDLFEEKIEKNGIKNISTMVGDATNLININGNEFDVVLVFGPMYHLPPEERDLVFKEAKRICKADGIMMFAYINKLGAYLQDGVLTDPNRYPNKNANEYVFVKETSDDTPGLFFFTSPGKMKENAENNELEVIKNVGVNFFFNKELINNMDDEKFGCWLEISEYMCNDESCTGLSTHSIIICKKSK
jgi:ubiquinone/menaquinone biosynthesis C-methylase UbiE